MLKSQHKARKKEEKKLNVETNVFEPKKLYYGDPYLKEWDTRVVQCNEGKNGYEIELEETIFFPEGGGQPSDQGVLICKDGTTVKVLQVKEKGKVIHICDQPLEALTKVHCQLNWERRFDYMQQHSGEHIFSGLVHAKYGFQNIGFHISDGIVTIDFDGVATLEQIKEIEKAANQYVWENHETKVMYPDKEALATIDYRSKMEIEGQVRLVEFPGADLCACCGTHVARSGEIGLIKVLSCVNWRGGIRIEMACGRWAFAYLDTIQTQNSAISVRLSAKIFETANAVERIMNESSALRGKVAVLEEKELLRIAEEYKGEADALIFAEGLSSEQVRKLCDLILNSSIENGGICRVFSGNDTDGYKYAIGQNDGDVRELVKAMNATLNGRGGGKPFFAQGSVMARKEEIRQFFEA